VEKLRLLSTSSAFEEIDHSKDRSENTGYRRASVAEKTREIKCSREINDMTMRKRRRDGVVLTLPPSPPHDRERQGAGEEWYVVAMIDDG
jgi:hypothetical protein